jgi:hypothetical protein
MKRVLLKERNGNVDDKILKLTKEQYDFLLFLQNEEVIDDCNFEFINLDGLKEVSFGEE